MCFRARERGDNKGRARFERGFSLLKNSSRVSRPILFSWFHNRGLNVSLFETQESRPDDGFPPRRSIAILLRNESSARTFPSQLMPGKALWWCINALYIAAISLFRVCRDGTTRANFFFLSVSDPFFPFEQKQRRIQGIGG